MTSEQKNKMAQHIDKQLSEFFDGYVLIGFDAISQSPIVVSSSSDGKTAAALNMLLSTTTVDTEPMEDHGTSEEAI